MDAVGGMAKGPLRKFHPTDHALDRADEIRVPRTSFDEVLTRRYRIRPNDAPGRFASHVLIGRNDRDDCLTIPVAYDVLPGDWIAVTVWHCDAEEVRALGR
jgi:hypothetical protein